VPPTKARRRARQGGPQGMTNRKAAPARPWPDHWTVSYEITVNRRQVEPGTELTLVGGGGRYRFIKHVKVDEYHEWIDAMGPTGRFKSFRPNQVDTVHRIKRTRQGVQS
jgi:hypothetical protein